MFLLPAPVRSAAWPCRSRNMPVRAMSSSPTSISIASIWQKKWPRDVRNLVQNDRDDPERPRHRAGHHPPLSLRRISRSDRADEIRQLRQDRPRLEPIVILSEEFSTE